MITLKLWNGLSQQSRSAICKIVGCSGKCEQQYFHHFDYDSLGKQIKLILESCNLQKDGSIKVSATVTPTYGGNTVKPVSAKKTLEKDLLSAINKDFASACAVMPMMIKKFGDTHRNIHAQSEFDWDYRIEGFYLSTKGDVYVDIYWQGDSTDGTLSELLSSFIDKPTVVIPAETYFDGNRTRTVHSDLRVKREKVYEAIKGLGEYLRA